MKAHAQAAAAVAESESRAEVPKDAGLQVLKDSLEKGFQPCSLHSSKPFSAIESKV